VISRRWRWRVGPLSLSLVKLPYGFRQVRVMHWGKNAVRELKLRGRDTLTADIQSRAMAEDLMDDPDLTTVQAS
jgi:hypothetical protein